MKLFEIFFSPTGGTKRILNKMSKHWDYEKTELDLSDRIQDFSKCIIDKNDLCIAAVPVFGGRVPTSAISNINRLHGNGAQTILIAVYGNRAYEDALLEFKDAMALAGFSCIAGVAAVAEHSIMHQFAAGRPDATDEKQLKAFSEKIKKIIKHVNPNALLHVPGNYPYKEYKVAPMVPEAGPRCIKCGLCAEKCPVGAIPKENPTLTKHKACISCMRCAAICPPNARHPDIALMEALAKKFDSVCSVRKENELFLIRVDEQK